MLAWQAPILPLNHQCMFDEIKPETIVYQTPLTGPDGLAQHAEHECPAVLCQILPSLKIGVTTKVRET